MLQKSEDEATLRAIRIDINSSLTIPHIRMANHALIKLVIVELARCEVGNPVPDTITPIANESLQPLITMAQDGIQNE